MFIEGLLNFYFIWSVVKQVLFFFLVLIFHSMFKKKNVFSNAMLLSINSLQYFVLSLSCHGCLFKQKKFLCLFFRETCIYVSPLFFFQWLYKTYLGQSLVFIITLCMYLGKRPLNYSNIFKIQSNQINTWLLVPVHACELWDLRKKIGFVLQLKGIIKLEFIF